MPFIIRHHLTEFHPETNSTSYTLIITTRFNSWQITKRFSDFISLNTSLLSENKLTPLPPLPPKRWFSKNSPSTIIERSESFQSYLSSLLQNPHCLYSPILMSFIQINTQILLLLQESQKFLNKKPLSTQPSFSYSDYSFTRNNSYMDMNMSSYNAMSFNNNSKSFTNSDNFYCNLFQLTINKQLSESVNNSNIKVRCNLNSCVIEEFLRNLNDNKDNMSATVKIFAEFYQNQIEKEYYFGESDIKLLFAGRDKKEATQLSLNEIRNGCNSNICIDDDIKLHTVKGLFYHIGNYKENIIGAEACIMLLLKLLSYESNLDYDSFVNVCRKLSNKCISQMKLKELIKIKGCNVLNDIAKRVLKMLYNNGIEIEKVFMFDKNELFSQNFMEDEQYFVC